MKDYLYAVFGAATQIYGYCSQDAGEDIYNKTKTTIETCESRIGTNLKYLEQFEKDGREYMHEYENSGRTNTASYLKWEQAKKTVQLYRRNVEGYTKKLNNARQIQLKTMRVAETEQNDDLIIEIAEKLKKKRNRKVEKARTVIDMALEEDEETPIITQPPTAAVSVISSAEKSAPAQRRARTEIRPLEEFEYSN